MIHLPIDVRSAPEEKARNRRDAGEDNLEK